MVRTVITPDLVYSESLVKAPRFDNPCNEEQFITKKIQTWYPNTESLIKFCRKCRKYIRLASRRQIINEIDTTCLHLIQKYLYLAEKELFENRNDFPIITHKDYQDLNVETNLTGFRITGWSRLLAVKRYKSLPTLAVDKQKRMDTIEKEVSRVLDILSDGYF